MLYIAYETDDFPGQLSQHNIFFRSANKRCIRKYTEKHDLRPCVRFCANRILFNYTSHGEYEAVAAYSEWAASSILAAQSVDRSAGPLQAIFSFRSFSIQRRYHEDKSELSPDQRAPLRQQHITTACLRKATVQHEYRPNSPAIATIPPPSSARSPTGSWERQDPDIHPINNNGAGGGGSGSID